MAGKMKSYTSKKEEVSSKYPSMYGSHKSMVDENYKRDDNSVVCVDEHGPYITELDKLDSGLADLNRYDLEYRRRPK